MKKYPIVFSSDRKYLVCAEVAINSIIKNRSNDKFYDIYFFHDNLLEDEMSNIKKLSCENVSITCVNINSYIDNNILYERLYFTKAMYYRILIPNILSEYKKVLYLDCDLVVNCDIAEIFDEEIGNNLIAGVHDLFEDEQKLYVNSLEVNENFYINSGVLLFNVAECIKFNIAEKFFELLSNRKDLRCPDQDAVNIVCQNKIHLLDMRWNFQWGGTLSRIKRVIYSEKLKREYQSAAQDVKIYHFTTAYKPWIYNKEKLAKYWWINADHIEEARLKALQKSTKQKITLKRILKNIVRTLFGGKFYIKLKIFIKRKK